MNRKSILFSFLGLLTIGTFFSCKKEKVIAELEKPTIEIKEVGLNNSKIAYAGQDLHLDAEIKAAGKIASIKVQITLNATDLGWDFIKTYTTGYAGIKNADFHEHIDVPENARTGKYDLLIVVIDEQGQRTQDKVHFEVVRDLSLPVISGISLQTSNSSINLSGLINAPNKIEKLVVEVQSSAWTKEFSYTDEAMVGQVSYQLDRNIDISNAPNGHYHVNITVIDKLGKIAGYHYHFDKD